MKEASSSIKSFAVEIESLSPLLMNRRGEMGKDLSDEEDAKNKSYFEEKIGYYLPSDMFIAAMRECGKRHKSKGQATYSKLIPASVFITPDIIPLGRHNFDAVDKRYAVQQKKDQILCRRARFDKWKVAFKMEIDTRIIKKDTALKILTESGLYNCIGGYRPRFGRFKVVKFAEDN